MHNNFLSDQHVQICMPWRFLLSIDRRQSVSEAEDTVELAIEYKDKYDGLVVGVDLSGDPKVRKTAFV